VNKFKETYPDTKVDLEKEIKILREKLEKIHEKFIQLEKMAMLGHLVSGVGHEINTPIAAINSNVNLFSRLFEKLKEVIFNDRIPNDLKKDPQLLSILENIDKLNNVNEEAVGRVVSMVNSLRSFARQNQDEMEEVDIHEGLENTLTIIHHLLKNKIDVKKNYSEVPKIKCYSNQINQVFMNLLVNASQSIEGEGEISISTYEKNQNLVIEIEDTGKGISNNNLNCIFEPGFTTKKTGDGTGLGLSIVNQIIEDHDGGIEVESEIGKGSIFRIYLPYEKE